MVPKRPKPVAAHAEVAAKQKLKRRRSVLEGIALGEKAIQQGQLISHEEVKSRLHKWLR